MLKLIIVDDEFLIRDGLVRNVSWEKLGYQVIGSAENGAEALELIQTSSPDVVLTDIRMPFMDGFELISHINHEFPDIRVIFISGHEEFDYAKRALRENACDYLLKPIHLEDLAKTMLRVKEEIHARRAQEASLERMQSTLAKVSPLLREAFLKDVLFGKLSSDDISSRAQEHDLPLEAHWQVALIQIDDYYQAASQNLFDLQHQLEIYLDTLCTQHSNCILFTKSVNEYVLLCFTSPEGHSAAPSPASQGDDKKEADLCNSNQLGAYAQQIMEWASSHFISLTIAIGACAHSLAMLPSAYESAMRTADLKFLRGGGRMLNYEDLEKNPLTVASFSDCDIRPFLDSFRFADKQTVLNEFEALQTEVLHKHFTNIMVQVVCSNILLEVKRTTEEQGADMEGVLPNATKLYQKLMDQPTAAAMFELLKSIICTLVDYRDTVLSLIHI